MICYRKQRPVNETGPGIFNVQCDVVLVENLPLLDSESLSVLRYAGDDMAMNWYF